MPIPKIVAFSQQAVEPVLDHPRIDRCLTGNPQRTTWEHFTNASGEFSCGIWACEVGAWRIEFSPDKDEFFCVIEGLVRLVDQAGEVVEISEGEAAVIPAGFKGIFEVVRPVRKYFVVLDRKT